MVSRHSEQTLCLLDIGDDDIIPLERGYDGQSRQTACLVDLKDGESLKLRYDSQSVQIVSFGLKRR